MEDFLYLKQEGMIVAQHEAKFMELFQFGQEFISTYEKTPKRYQNGLKPYLKGEVFLFELKTYCQVVNKALKAEKDNEELQ